MYEPTRLGKAELLERQELRSDDGRPQPTHKNRRDWADIQAMRQADIQHEVKKTPMRTSRWAGLFGR